MFSKIVYVCMFVCMYVIERNKQNQNIHVMPFMLFMWISQITGVWVSITNQPSPTPHHLGHTNSFIVIQAKKKRKKPQKLLQRFCDDIYHSWKTIVFRCKGWHANNRKIKTKREEAKTHRHWQNWNNSNQITFVWLQKRWKKYAFTFVFSPGYLVFLSWISQA